MAACPEVIQHLGRDFAGIWPLRKLQGPSADKGIMAETITRRAGTKTRNELLEERRAEAEKRSVVPRILRMVQTLVFAGVMAGLSAICLGLVDAGHEIDLMLGRLEYDAASLNRTSASALENRGSADLMAAPQTRLTHALDTFPQSAEQVIRTKTPSWCAPAATVLASVIDLVPSEATLKSAFRDYVDQIKQAQAEISPSPGALELRNRLLDLKYETLLNRISGARERTRLAVTHALTGLQAITLTSVAITALFVGLSRDN